MANKKEKARRPCFFCDEVSPGTFGCEKCVPEEWRYIEIHEQKIVNQPSELDEVAKRLQRKIAYKRK